jgi:ferric-dicitrate binding protein FerR (iron transport regulator)
MKNLTDAERWRLLELCERAVSEQISPEERSDLNGLMRTHEEARELFARALQQHAELRYDNRLVKELAGEAPRVPAGGSQNSSRKDRTPWGPSLLAAAAGVAIMGFVTAMWGWQLGPSKLAAMNPTVATVIKARECKWAGSTLPTAEGSRVTTGILELAEGIATLKFDSGAEVVMEAPATLEIVNAMECRLVRGTLMADVPPSAIGFVVETPDARVVDYGTRFGVSAGEDGKYLVKVLEGLVEVNPKSETGKPRQLRGGQSVDNGLRQLQLVPPPADLIESRRWHPKSILDAGDGWQIISTAYGRGKDTYVQNGTRGKGFGKDPYFRVKRSDFSPELIRKGYIAFDLAKFQGQEKTDAELVLNIEPSDLGFASLVPDSTFAVYGLADEDQDTWNEHSVQWQQAPAQPAAKDLKAPKHLPDPGKSVLLGRFTIAQGVSRGTRSIQGKALLDFLKQDTNGIVTFIICRETNESSRDGMVHAFATKESGSNTPPLLRVKVAP